MIQNFLLSGTLTDFQLKLLDLIQHLHQATKEANRITSRNKEPAITLQYANIVALFRCSPCTIKTALDRLYALRLIDEVEKNYSECATYRYNPNVYRSLIRKAKARKCTLFSGRPQKRYTTTGKRSRSRNRAKIHDGKSYYQRSQEKVNTENKKGRINALNCLIRPLYCVGNISHRPKEKPNGL